ncbi:extracellular solute-binding protein [Alkalibacterium iburiense]|uniref:Extracellular solute-binding protein n=1 Tax=Alkalibacterium iburiense TaxID=290589 RepID=A0ABN0XSG2_9LACT
MIKLNKKLSTVVMLSSLILMACGNGDGETAESTNNGNDNNTDETSVEAGTYFESLTVMAPTFETTAPPADNEWELNVEEVAGVDLDINWVPNSNYEDRMNVTLASTDIPELMVIQGKTPGFLNSAEAGAFWDLTDYLDDFDHLSTYNPDVLNNASVNGRVYGIYRGRDVMRHTALMRKDWLENLDLDVPETIDEYTEVLRAFTFDDPNGSGADDTYGLMESNIHAVLDVAHVWFGAPNQWAIEDGEFIPSFTTEEYKASLDWFKGLVEEGLVNPDFTTLSPDDLESEIFNGNGGSMVATYSNTMRLNNLFADSEGVERDDAHFMENTGTLRSPLDDQEYGFPTEGYAGFIAIPKTSVQTEEELIEVLGYLDNLSSADGLNALNHGIEGVTYEVNEDGYLVPIETEEALNLRAYEMGQISTYGDGMLEPVVVNPLQKERLRLMEMNEAAAVHNEAAPFVSETYTTRGQQLNEIISDARVLYVAGQISEDEWYAAVDRWFDSGGEQVIEEFNELYQEHN